MNPRRGVREPGRELGAGAGREEVGRAAALTSVTLIIDKASDRTGQLSCVCRRHAQTCDQDQHSSQQVRHAGAKHARHFGTRRKREGQGEDREDVQDANMLMLKRLREIGQQDSKLDFRSPTMRKRFSWMRRIDIRALYLVSILALSYQMLFFFRSSHVISSPGAAVGGQRAASRKGCEPEGELAVCASASSELRMCVRKAGGRRSDGFSRIDCSTAGNVADQIQWEARRGVARVLEVGYGLGAFPLASATAGHRVFSVKPDHEEFRLMTRSVQLNNLSASWHVAHAQVSELEDSEAGEGEREARNVATLFENNDGQKQHVNLRRLLAWFHEQGGLDLLQLSYNGSEIALLRSASLQIQPHRIPFILLEFDPKKLLLKNHDPEEVLELLHAKGYGILSLVEDEDLLPEDFHQFSSQVGNSSTLLLARRSERRRPRPQTNVLAYSRLMYILSCSVAIVFGLVGCVLSMLHI
eukprot:752331-Hanusia_phi.AAC.3